MRHRSRLLLTDLVLEDSTGNHIDIRGPVNLARAGVSLLFYWQQLQGVQMVLEKNPWPKDIKAELILRP